MSKDGSIVCRYYFGWIVLFLGVFWVGCGSSSKSNDDIQATTDPVAKAAQEETSSQAAPNPNVRKTIPDPPKQPPAPSKITLSKTSTLPPVSNPHEHLIALALEFQKSSQSSSDEGTAWLLQHAQFPFDFDGKIRVEKRDTFQESLSKHLPKFFTQLTSYTTCEARSRSEILDGKSWHYIDRLGERPPRKELQRDLDRLGMEAQDWLVNCYKDNEAGFFLIVSLSKDASTIKALRN